MKKREGLKTKINLSNRIFYSLVTLGIIIILAGSAYAYTASGAGHNSNEIDVTSGFTKAIFNTANFPQYGQTSLQTWGLSSTDTMYLEPFGGKTLYITDQWSKTGDLNIQMGKTVFPTGNVGIGTETPSSTAKLDIAGTTGTALLISGGGDIVISSQVKGASSTIYNDVGTLSVSTPFSATSVKTATTGAGPIQAYYDMGA
jgi:hypothetical protein